MENGTDTYDVKVELDCSSINEQMELADASQTDVISGDNEPQEANGIVSDDIIVHETNGAVSDDIIVHETNGAVSGESIVHETNGNIGDAVHEPNRTTTDNILAHGTITDDDNLVHETDRVINDDSKLNEASILHETIGAIAFGIKVEGTTAEVVDLPNFHPSG